MLAVAVELDIDIVSVLEGVHVSCLYCTADTEVSRKIEDVEAMLAAKLERPVARSIVHYDVLESRIYYDSRG